jgi:hypothetical protein
MKDKFWGLKKDEVDRFMRKMEREIQFELQKLEFDLISTKKENERLLDLIYESEQAKATQSVNESLLELAKERITPLMHFQKKQKESEITSLRKASDERISMYQLEINKLEEELKVINGIIGSFLGQLDIEPIQNKHSEDQMITSFETINHEENETTLKERIESFQKEAQVETYAEPISIGEIEKEELQGLITTSTEDQILEQILSFKEQYMNGKVTGTDLYNNAGRLIVPANTTISKEIVDFANSEGKLAELIVNMKISNNGEE